MSKKRKRHTLDDRIKYIKMIEDGYSVDYISNHFGISHHLLATLWTKYQKEGPLGLMKKQYARVSGALREEVLRDIEKNHLLLYEAAVKYDVSVTQIKIWRKKVCEYGYGALYVEKPRGRPPKNKYMGRPKKKKPEAMTELEQLRYENERLRAENALLKKVRALVEEREARLREIGRKPSKN